MTSQYGRGISLRAAVESPTYTCAVSDKTPYLDCAVVRAEQGAALTLFLLNRSMDAPLRCTAAIDGFAPKQIVLHTGLHGCAPDAVNTADAAPVQPRALTGAALRGQTLEVTLPPASWSVLRLA